MVVLNEQTQRSSVYERIDMPKEDLKLELELAERLAEHGHNVEYLIGDSVAPLKTKRFPWKYLAVGVFVVTTWAGFGAYFHLKIQAKNQFATILKERNQILAAQKPNEMVVRFNEEPVDFGEGQLEALRDSLLGKADLTARRGRNGATILHWAIKAGVDDPTLKLLVDNGADPNAQTRSTVNGELQDAFNGMTPLIMMCRNHRWGQALWFVSNIPNVDVNIANAGNQTALTICLEKKMERGSLMSQLQLRNLDLLISLLESKRQ